MEESSEHQTGSDVKVAVEGNSSEEMIGREEYTTTVSVRESVTVSEDTEDEMSEDYSEEMSEDYSEEMSEDYSEDYSVSDAVSEEQSITSSDHTEQEEDGVRGQNNGQNNIGFGINGLWNGGSNNGNGNVGGGFNGNFNGLDNTVQFDAAELDKLNDEDIKAFLDNYTSAAAGSLTSLHCQLLTILTVAVIMLY